MFFILFIQRCMFSFPHHHHHTTTVIYKNIGSISHHYYTNTHTHTEMNIFFETCWSTTWQTIGTERKNKKKKRKRNQIEKNEKVVRLFEWEWQTAVVWEKKNFTCKAKKKKNYFLLKYHQFNLNWIHGVVHMYFSSMSIFSVCVCVYIYEFFFL